MDASPLFDPEYLPIIVATLVGFGVLAALLLVPISRFLDREQEVAQDWTPDAVAERIRERQRTDTKDAPSSDSSDSPKQENTEPSVSPQPDGSR